MLRGYEWPEEDRVDEYDLSGGKFPKMQYGAFCQLLPLSLSMTDKNVEWVDVNFSWVSLKWGMTGKAWEPLT